VLSYLVACCRVVSCGLLVDQCCFPESREGEGRGEEEEGAREVAGTNSKPTTNNYCNETAVKLLMAQP